MNHEFSDIAKVIGQHQRFGLASHVRPDGDAVGSLLGLGLCLKEMGKDVAMILEDEVPEALVFLPGTKEIRRADGKSLDIEVAIALDTATRPRLGAKVIDGFSSAKTWVNIDHHVSNPRYGDLNHIDASAPATGQILADFITQQAWPMTKAMAENLFAAISTDTGSFQYPSTTSRTYQTAARLIDAGIDVGQISQRLYESYPLRRLTLMRELLGVLKMSHGNRVASWHLTQEMMARHKLKPDDSEGLIDVIRAVDSVLVAVFFEELPDGKIRVSARSKQPTFDVGQICGQFGGGGHRLAAGARLPGPLADAEAKFLARVYEAVEGRS